MKKIVILIGSFCYNRGSEALVRGTIDIVKKYIPDSSIVLCSGEENFGAHLNIENVDTYVRRQSYYSGFSFNRIRSNLYSKLLHNKKAADRVKYQNLLAECKEADLVIVSGGDNYDKSYGMIDLMHSVNAAIRENSKAKMVMYDCSLDCKEIDENVKKDFALFDAITAREEDTYRGFLEAFPNKSVYYYPDPAFVMGMEKVKLPDGLVPGDTIGVNVSSMVTETHYGSNSQSVLQAYVKMIEWALKNTEHTIMLIPHVMRNLDLKVLRRLYQFFENDKRVFLVDNEALNAKQLKYLISQCTFYVGARTHSTIAAYSTYVPTLVLGYSVKSIGIARDLFGTDAGYVVPVKQLDSDQVLADAFEALYVQKDTIKKKMEQSIIPQYIEKAMSAGKLFKNLTEDKNDFRNEGFK